MTAFIIINPFLLLLKLHVTDVVKNIYFMNPEQDICAHSALISYQHIPRIHSEPINRILYEPHDELIITSSESPASSVVIMDVNQKREKYIWRTEKVIYNVCIVCMYIMYVFSAFHICPLCQIDQIDRWMVG